MPLEDIDPSVRDALLEFVGGRRPIDVEETIARRFAKGGVRGATLGLAGGQRKPGDIAGGVGEFVGSVAPIMAIGAGAGPVVGALRLPALAAKVGTAALTGGMFETARGVIAGEPAGKVAKEAAIGAAAFGAFPLAGKAYRYLRPLPKVAPAATAQAIETAIGTEVVKKGEQLGLGIKLPTAEGEQLGLELPRLQGEAGAFPEPTVYRSERGKFRSATKPSPAGTPQPYAPAEVPQEGRFSVTGTSHFVEEGFDPLTGVRRVRAVTRDGELAIDKVLQEQLSLRAEQIELFPPDKEHYLKSLEQNISARNAVEAPLRRSAEVAATAPHREATKVSELLKQSDEALTQHIESGQPSSLGELAEVKLTPEGRQVRELVAKAGLNEEELQGAINKIMANVTQDQREAALLAYLRSKCL